MEQLIHAFGIDLRLIVIQIINFTILVAVLSYFLYKPVLKLLADREEKVKQSIKDAEAAAAAKASAEEEKRELLTKAHKEADTINQRAKESAEERALEIVKTADAKAVDVMTAGERKAGELKEQALKESEAEIAKLAILAAEKVLKEKAS